MGAKMLPSILLFMTKASLLKKASKGDRRAQFELYKGMHGVWLPITYRYFSNEDEQVGALNQAYLKILDNLEDFLKKNEADRFEFWSRRIIINTCIDHIRSKQRRGQVRDTDWQEEEYLSDEHDQNLADAAFEAEELEIMINTLGDTQKMVFNLYALEGYSHKEIAKQLGLSEDNSRYHLSQARKELKKKVLSALRNFKNFML